MYYQYWGLHKPAFDNVPDPSMYVDCHASMENAIAETLFAIEEGDECIAVIVGDVGLGKTMSIRMIIDSLDQERYKIALITNPGISFVQIMQEIIGQLTGSQCPEKRKVNLLEIFNQLLFSTFAEGKKILIFIDEANAITPVNLEQLRLLTNMQSDKRNLFTMVLAGQIEFGRRLEHPKRANLFQRVGTYCRIDKLESAEKVKKYVETRLLLAGAKGKVFADDAFDRLWEQSDRGVPRLVNKLAKLCLKAGETNGFAVISGEMVDQIGSRFHKLNGPAIEKRRSRLRSLPDLPAALAEELDETDLIAPRPAAAEAEASPAPNLFSTGPTEEERPARLETVPPAAEIVPPAGGAFATASAAPAAPALLCAVGDDAPGTTVGAAAPLPRPAGSETRAAQSGEMAALAQPLAAESAEAAAPHRGERAADLGPALLAGREPQETPARTEANAELEMCIGKARIRIDLPDHLLKQSLAITAEHRFKLAGGLAAETLRKHPDLIESQTVDPVPIWVAIRDFVLNRMSHAAGV